MTLAERLDQLDLSGQMVRVIWNDAMKFIQQFLRDTHRLRVFHAVDDSVAYRADGSETQVLLKPIDEAVRRRLVLGGFHAAAAFPIPSHVVESQTGAELADAVHRSMEPSFWRFVSPIEREFDARRASIDRQDRCHG